LQIDAQLHLHFDHLSSSNQPKVRSYISLLNIEDNMNKQYGKI